MLFPRKFSVGTGGGIRERGAIRRRTPGKEVDRRGGVGCASSGEKKGKG